MNAERTLYVRLIDGVECLAPVMASQNPDGTFSISANPEFDPEDTATLFEFLPGDIVRAEPRAFSDSSPTPALVATELVCSTIEDRDYWAVVFCMASDAAACPAFNLNRLQAIAARVRSEIDSGVRWHCPSVVEWARGSR